jgi:hypothetical protein
MVYCCFVENFLLFWNLVDRFSFRIDSSHFVVQEAITKETVVPMFGGLPTKQLNNITTSKLLLC